MANNSADLETASKFTEKSKEDVLVGVVPTGSLADRKTATARALKSRHMQLISIGGVIGTGLFIGSDQALVMAGPLSCLIAYSTYCFIVWCITQTTGELATLLAYRFIDPAAGVTCGWSNVYACIAFACADITAVTGLFQYWLPDSSPAIWVSYCLVVIFILNAFAVRIYGEAEFYFASGKVILIIGFIVFTFVAMLGGNPHHDRIGFRYWKDPDPMAEYLVDGALGRFLGF